MLSYVGARVDTNFSKSGCAHQSEDFRLICGAVLIAKKNYKATGLSGTNTHQKYKYARLVDIYDAVEPALMEQDVLITHASYADSGVEYLATRLTHAPSGQWIQDTRISESEKPGNQGKGAANTYMRKLAVLNLCAIAAEDDDGEDEQRYVDRNTQPLTITQQQATAITNLITSCTNPSIVADGIKNIYNIKRIVELKTSCFDAAWQYVLDNK